MVSDVEQAHTGGRGQPPSRELYTKSKWDSQDQDVSATSGNLIVRQNLSLIDG